MPARDRGPQVPYRRVADALRARLDAGEWLPGEALPGARVLAGEYGVSHATVSRAVDVLAAEGLADRGPGLGDVRRRTLARREGTLWAHNTHQRQLATASVHGCFRRPPAACAQVGETP